MTAVIAFSLLAAFGGYALHRLAQDGGADGAAKSARQNLVERINACLPQLQCGKCDYPGCRPYAEAVAANSAPIDRCPPGGAGTVTQLAQLLEQEMPGIALPNPAAQKAVIREDDCVGCALCLPVCPTDAIVGAAKYAHTVIAKDCVGCALCADACPVDCIVMEDDDKEKKVNDDDTAETIIHFSTPAIEEQPCIRCARCDDVCPMALSPMTLHRLNSDRRDDEMQDENLSACILCRRCDSVCPSHIPLTAQWTAAQQRAQQHARQQAQQNNWQRRYEQHLARQNAPVARADRDDLRRWLRDRHNKKNHRDGDGVRGSDNTGDESKPAKQ